MTARTGLAWRTDEPCPRCPSPRLGLCRTTDFGALDESVGLFSEDRRFAKGSVLYHQDAQPACSLAIQQGWVALVTLSPAGERQILDFALPGSLIGFHGISDQPLNHSAECLTPVRARLIAAVHLKAVLGRRPDLAMRFAQIAACAELRAQDHQVNIGLRRAQGRIAHLLLTLFLRAKGRLPDGTDDVMPLPLRLADLGGATALTAVHVSRVLSQLRAEGVVDLRGGTLRVLNPTRLLAVAGDDADPVAG